ncbi:MAG: CoA transferase [Ilumatobacteraceae bacterium]|nr:CoA transferase [Ilumatobacteraceae bacterium]
MAGAIIWHGVPNAPVNFPHEIDDDPQAIANGDVTELEHRDLGAYRTPTAPLQMERSPIRSEGHSPHRWRSRHCRVRTWRASSPTRTTSGTSSPATIRTSRVVAIPWARSSGLWRHSMVAHRPSSSARTSCGCGPPPASRSCRPRPARSASFARYRGIVRSRARCWLRRRSRGPYRRRMPTAGR